MAKTKGGHGGGARGKKRKPSGRIGGIGGYKGVKRSKVNSLVDGIINAEVRQQRESSRSAQDTYERSVGDINAIFRETDKGIKATNATYAQNRDAAKQGVNESAARQQSNLASIYGGAASGVNAELERLGINGAAGTGVAGLMADQAWQQGEAIQSRDNINNIINVGAGNNAALGSALLSMNTGERVSQLGQARNTRDTAVSKVRDAIIEARKKRPDLFNQMLEQLQNTGWNQYFQNQQLKKMK